ncbi:MAG: tRNA (guanosine(37)-N1)-methyltransferase TrmD, partial [Clostridia bacterium]|nr:tRNA (guanosine(37)-N1)-methyltransferase TrmD [Clostridia bacterium]
MNFEVLTLFPRSLEPIFSSSILGRASDKGLINITCTDIRDYTLDKHRRVDDSPYGGGYGMVMMCQPVVDCIRAVKSRLTGTSRVIYMSP